MLTFSVVSMLVGATLNNGADFLAEDPRLTNQRCAVGFFPLKCKFGRLVTDLEKVCPAKKCTEADEELCCEDNNMYRGILISVMVLVPLAILASIACCICCCCCCCKSNSRRKPDFEKPQVAAVPQVAEVVFATEPQVAEPQVAEVVATEPQVAGL